jgi:hypothetical protein
VKLEIPALFKGKPALDFIGELGRPLSSSESVELDFSKLKRITPLGLVSLASSVSCWRRNHISVSLKGLESCEIREYLQRMDLLKILGLEYEEHFHRYESRGKFVPLQRLETDVNTSGYEIAQCLAPGGEDFGDPAAGLYDMIFYIFTELANNVLQHSGGNGYVAAQVNRNEGFVRIALSDNGQGIRESFRDAGMRVMDTLSDEEAILKALEPRVSSKGSPSNEGVGLTLVTKLVTLTKGWLLTASRTGIVQIMPGKKIVSTSMRNGDVFPGTLVAMVFKQTAATDFDKYLQQAKNEAGLLQNPVLSAKFSS